MKSVGSHRASGREKEGKRKGISIHGKEINSFLIATSMISFPHMGDNSTANIV